MKINIFLTVSLLIVLTTNYVNAQVTIGEKTEPTSTLDIKGSFSAASRSFIKDANFNIENNDYYISWKGSANGTATLPQVQTGTANFKGRVYHIKNTSSGYSLKIQPYNPSVEKIDENGGVGTTTLELKEGESVTLIKNGNETGATWEVIGRMNVVPAIEIPGAISAVYNLSGTNQVRISQGYTSDIIGNKTFTLDKPSTLLITYSTLPLPETAGMPVQGSIDLVIDNNKYISSYYSAADAPSQLARLGNYSTSQAVIDLNAGTHTIKLQAKSWYSTTLFNINPVTHNYIGSDSKDINAMSSRVTIIVFNR